MRGSSLSATVILRPLQQQRTQQQSENTGPRYAHQGRGSDSHRGATVARTGTFCWLQWSLELFLCWLRVIRTIPLLVTVRSPEPAPLSVPVAAVVLQEAAAARVDGLPVLVLQGARLTPLQQQGALQVVHLVLEGPRRPAVRRPLDPLAGRRQRCR